MTAMILLSEWQKSQIEFWRPSIIDGYDVSNFGRARSYWIQGHGLVYKTSHRRDVPIVLNPSRDSNGYLYINARTNVIKGQRRCPKVHRLVAIAFLPNPDNKPEVNHRTGIKHDARLDNLEWMTREENMQHRHAVGLMDGKVSVGESHYLARVSDADVLEMIRLFEDEGVRPRILATMFGTTYYNAWDITHNRGRAKKLKGETQWHHNMLT